MPRKSFKDLHFKTAEQIKLNSKKLKCKICGKKMRGKSTLSRHISHAHSKIPPVKREKMVIDAYFGQAKVDDAIKKYKNRTYNLSTIPIDISRYIRLAEIEQDDVEKIKTVKKIDLDKIDRKKPEIPENYSVVKVVDKSEEDSPIYFVEDAVFDMESQKFKLKLTQTLDQAIPLVLLREGIKKLGLEDSKIYIELNDELYVPDSIETIPDEEVTEDRVQSTVAFHRNSSSKKQEDK